jgi:PTS system mannose-specific IID component
MSKKNTALSTDEQTMLKKMFNRSWFLFAGFNFANFQGMGYSAALRPALAKFYADDQKKHQEALIRSVQFFNCTYETAPFIMGLNAAMEKENSEKEGFGTESIDAVKAALMGPLSAIGDSVFWGVVRLIATSIAIPLAAQGSVLAPILFLLVFHVPSIFARYNLLTLGYTTGTQFLRNLNDNDLIKRITYCISIVGMIMIGSMVAQFVNIRTPLQVSFGSGETLVLQDVLDSIFKGLLGIGATFGCLALMRKKVKVLYLVFGVLVLGILLALVGFFK